MIEKLEAIKAKFDDLGIALTNPEIVGDNKRFTQISKEYRKLEPIVTAYNKYRNCLDGIAFGKEVLETESDEDLRQMAKEDLDQQEEEKTKLEEEIRQLLIPKDPTDEKNAIMEIRAGTGGDEASIFAGDLLRMYMRFCEKKGWKVALLSEAEGTAGGYKEVQIEISGEDVYGVLKFESGVHRVQRVPATEASGRVHTSAATVAVMPEAEEIDKVETKVMLTHKPTGTVIICQTERTQLGNREKAMAMLRTKLYEEEVRKHEEAIASRRKSLVSTGDRSAKIRTYNYPQGRVTDHRINMTIYSLDDFMNGDIGEMTAALQFAENSEKMKAGESV
jgi:peptide chain release factor 1